MTLRHHFAALLRTHRGERDRVAIANAVGGHRDYITAYEEGDMLPRLPVYIRLCRAYNLTLAQRAELDEIAAGMSAGGEA